MERRAITFIGRVQGVGFRATASSLADGRPVTGWVRNEPDGSVRLEVQGPPDDIEEYLTALRDRLGMHIREEHSRIVAAVEEETGFETRF